MENKIKLDPEKTYTKSEYSKTFGISRPTIDKMIKESQLKVLKVKGTVLIVL